MLDEAWPAPYTEDNAGWRFRYAGGVTKRANSVWPRTGPGDIAAAEAFYSARGLPTVFQLGDGLRDDLDDRLAARGYTVVDPTLVMITSSDGPRPDHGTVIENMPSAGWMDVWWSVDGRYPGQAGTARQIITGVPAGYARLGDAVGRAVPQGEWLGIYCMAVAPSARRQGLARKVLDALLNWGHEQGIHQAYLTVTEHNTAARTLYDQAGFRTVSAYHYRVRRPPLRPADPASEGCPGKVKRRPPCGDRRFVCCSAAGLPVVVGDGGGGREQPVGFIVDFGARFAQRLAVLAAVVSAEQQLAARELRANVSLGATAVASVRGRQRLGRGNRTSHVASSSRGRSLRTTSNPTSAFPCGFCVRPERNAP